MKIKLIGILFVLVAVGIIPIQYPSVDSENFLPIITSKHDAFALNNPPIANAGLSQNVTSGQIVLLDGSSSFDPDPSTALTYQWTQISGIPVMLSSGPKSGPFFTAPQTSQDIILKFMLVVNDGQVNSSPAIVSITVKPKDSSKVPSSPSELTGTAARNEIDLYWNQPSSDGGSPITEYEVERSTDGGSNWFNVYQTNSTAPRYQDTRFDPGITYTYRVFAINAKGTSDPSNTISLTGSNGTVHSDDKFVILFKSGAFTPNFGIINKTAIKDGHGQYDKVHFLLQFIEIPNSTDRKNIAKLGIDLTDYVTGNTYVAAARVSDLDNLDNVSIVRWAGPLLPEYKISPILKTNNLGDIPKWAVVNKPGFLNQVVVTIDLNKGANLNDVANNIIAIGGTIEAKIPIIPSITVYVDLGKVNDIAKLDDVQFISPVDPALYETNDKARITAGVGPPLSPIDGLTGLGVTVLVYDAGVVDFHHDFGICSLPLVWPACHIVDRDSSSTVMDHATHVAGTVGGSGVWSNSPPNPITGRVFMGMAPHVAIKSYGFNPPATVALPEFNDQSDINNDFTKAITTGSRIDLATMSLGIKVAANCLDPSLLGQYGPTSKTIDSIVTGNVSRYPLIFFEAAGNNRDNTNSCTDGLGNTIHYPDFASIDPPASAKDSIAVGAINSNDYSLWEKTSFGPTNDGRLKPDITAPGCRTDDNMGIMSTIQNQEYQPMCGTSQATPVAAGVAALLVEKWHFFHSNITPLPDTIKAILIHTALDLGKPGPDYKFGWGAINAKPAANLILDDKAYNLIHVGRNLINIDQINAGDPPKSFYFVSDGKVDVRATLVWDDPPSTLLPVPNLINQLDLHLKDPNGKIYEPFLLNPDPLYRDDAAKRGNDFVNVVKMANGSAQSGNWTAIVDAALVTSGPQNFTLIISPEYKRPTNTLVKQWVPDPPIVTIGNHGTVNATVSDIDSGTPIPPNGTVNFFDGAGLALSNLGCSHINGKLVCTADYSPSSVGDFRITADYIGDPPHNISNNDIIVKGKCLIATAAFGSELSPQVQFLREFRDNHLLKTSAGSSFMGVFNTWYYSFSPYVADYEYQHSWFKQTVKVSLYPLLGILQISQKAFLLFDGNYGAMVAGMTAVSLIGAVYVSPIAISIKKVRNTKFNYRVAACLFSILIISALCSILIGNYYAIVTTSLLFLLALITVSAILSAKLILRIINLNSKLCKEKNI